MGPLRRAMYSGMDTLGHWLFQGEEDVEGAAEQGQEDLRRGMCWGLTDSRIWNLLWCYTQGKTCSSTNEAPELRIKGFLGCLRIHGVTVLSRASVCGCQSKPLSFSAQWQHENKWHTEKRDGRKTSEIEQDSGGLFRSDGSASWTTTTWLEEQKPHSHAAESTHEVFSWSCACISIKQTRRCIQWRVKAAEGLPMIATTPRLTRLHLRLLYFDLIFCLTVYWFGWILFFPRRYSLTRLITHPAAPPRCALNPLCTVRLLSRLSSNRLRPPGPFCQRWSPSFKIHISVSCRQTSRAVNKTSQSPQYGSRITPSNHSRT